MSALDLGLGAAFLVVLGVALGWRRRALAAEAVKAAGGPSTTSDVNDLRAWRERRAVLSIDHTQRHFAEGVLASEWATEVMQLCVGPMEVEGGE